jgi:hypothetical protein
MLSQLEPKFFGVIHDYPRFERDMFVRKIFEIELNGKKHLVRGLREREECFF